MGAFNKHLRCHKNQTIELCPLCNSLQKPKDEWPESGTHVFTIPYECGTQIDFPIGHNGATYGVTCDGEIKRIEYNFEKDVDI